MTVRLCVKELAEAKNMTMTRLHIRSEVAYNTIRLIFHNPYTIVTTETLDRLAIALGVDVRELLESELLDEKK